MNVKKRFLSFLLTLSMAITMLPMGALAAEEPKKTEEAPKEQVSALSAEASPLADINTDISGDTEWADKSVITKAITITGTTTTITVNGTVTVKAPITVPSGAKVTFTDTDTGTDATGTNGVLVRDPSFKGDMFNVATGGELNLGDITLDGAAVEAVAAEGSLVKVESGATLNITATTLTNNNNSAAKANGGAIFTAGAVTMTGGEISGNSATVYGGGVYVAAGGSFVMNDGFIINNNAIVADASGGGICLEPNATSATSVTIRDGIISGNQAGANGAAIHGGANGTITISGTAPGPTKITGNTSRVNSATTHPGGAVYPFGAVLNISGAPIINNNIGNAAGTYAETQSNIFLRENEKITLDAALTGGSVGVTTVAAATTGEPQLITVASTGDPTASAEFIHSDMGYSVSKTAEANTLELALDHKIVYVSNVGEDTNEGSLTMPVATLNKAYEIVAAGGEIRVVSDIAVNTALNCDKTKNITITSYKPNGTAWEAEADTRTISRSTDASLFNITKGEITLKNIKITDGTSHTNSPICVNADCKLIMDTGATITETQSNFGAVYLFGGTLEMKSGSVISKNINRSEFTVDTGTFQGGGGGVTLAGDTAGEGLTATLIMSGGEISGNQAAMGGGVYVKNGTVKVSGKPIITGNTNRSIEPSNVLLTADKTIQLDEALAAGANIGVDLATPIAAEGDKADIVTKGTQAVLSTDAQYFTTDNSGEYIMEFNDNGENDTLVLKKLAKDVWVRSGEATNTESAAQGSDITGNGTIALPYESLGKAYIEVANNGTIHVMNDLTTEATAFNVDKTVNIVSSHFDTTWKDGAPANTIKNVMTDGAATYLINITAGTVNFKTIIIDGGADWNGGEGTYDDVLIRSTTNGGKHTTAAMLHIGTGATASLDNATLQNHDNQTTTNNGDKGGAVYVDGGELNMNSTSEITDNAVSGTASYSDGGAVSVWNNGVFNMNGGDINGNYAVRFGGAVRVDGSVMNINGGTIENNKCGSTGGAIDCHNGKGVVNLAPRLPIKIIDNAAGTPGGTEKNGGGIFTDSPLNISQVGSSKITITGNTVNGENNNVYLTSGNIINDAHDDVAEIGITTAATPSVNNPVQITKGTPAGREIDFKADNPGIGGMIHKSQGLYLDIAQRAAAQIVLHNGTKAVYQTLDEAMQAITADDKFGALLNADNIYEIELMANSKTNGAWPAKPMKITGIGDKHTIVQSKYIAVSAPLEINNIKMVATGANDVFHVHSTLKITNCDLTADKPENAVLNIAGRGSVNFVSGSANSNGTAIALGNSLTMKTGAVAVNGIIKLGAGKFITLAPGSTAARYTVALVDATNYADSHKIVDGTSADADEAAIAKKISIIGDTTKEWVAVEDTNKIVLKEAKAYYVSNTGADDAEGTFAAPMKTIEAAYEKAATNASANGPAVHIRVLSDLDSAALTMDEAALTTVVIESYSGDNVKAAKPWVITRNAVGTVLLTQSTGTVSLKNITLDGNGKNAEGGKAMVLLSNGALNLLDGATITNVNALKEDTDPIRWGAIVVGDNATLTMEDGSEISNISAASGCIRVDKATAKFTINGGLISNCDSALANEGNAIYISNGATVQMNGGKITGCGKTLKDSSGTVFLHQENSAGDGNANNSFIMTGGEISGNFAKIGGGVYTKAGNITLSGDAKISGNKNAKGEASNVYLANGQTVTIGGAHMGANSSVGVYCETMPTSVTKKVDVATNAIAADKSHFTSDKIGEAGIALDGDRVVLSYETRYVPSEPDPIVPITPPQPEPGITVVPGPGKVTISPQNPDPGTKVTVTIEPETGWQIGTVTIVTDPGGEPVTVTGTNPITYIAPKPNKVKITVTYKRIPVAPEVSGAARLLDSTAHNAYMVGDEFGKFNPESGITRAETAQMFYNLLRNKEVAAPAAFVDINQGIWYENAVNTLAKLGIVEGVGTKKFNPSAKISRAEFTAIAMRFAKAIEGTVKFNDVPASHWAYAEITGAAQYGWIMGYADGTFKPQGDITRAEAAKIVNTMLGRFADAKYIGTAKNLKAFSDVKPDFWGYYDIMEATNSHNFAKDKNGVETWNK